ncbi:polysaccharide deacetylase family protein [Streptomyces sp. NPDC048623]|uniref:polysaccharide deacetylase family protein n=1 Tax=Streptomyces sp. NPDC048623 TaxID=3155761 RepID=UPI003423B19D
MGLKGKYTAHIAAVASAVALSLAAWGTAVLTDSEAEASSGAGAGAGQERQVPPTEEGKGPAKVTPVKVPESIVHAAEAGGKAVNITIDDGPDPRWTPQILDVLRENDVKAVFCIVGQRAKEYPQLVKRVVAEGHKLCDHTMDHDTTMDRKPFAYQKQQILDAKRLIEEAAGGAKIEYYRAPGGAFTPDSRKLAAGEGMRPLGWNVDTKDFERPGAGVIVNTVKSELSNGPTILFHDGGGERSQTVAALREVLPWLKSQGHPTSFPVRTAP